ncbi:MAG: hypothetical protein CM15mV146_220 [uncultured marine virus]|nr:MAG: hypothetical protein CM15mV146_220 [uncultured marine virus]
MKRINKKREDLIDNLADKYEIFSVYKIKDYRHSRLEWAKKYHQRQEKKIKQQVEKLFGKN